MLRGLRKASSNWLGKTIMSVVLGVLIVSFGIWGIADMFKGYGQSTVAKVGGTEIGTDQFRQLYNDKLQQLGRQFGQNLTSDQARAFGIDRQVLQQTIAEAALDEDARRKGLNVSDDEVMRQIVSDPNFKGTNGAFDASRFQQMIASLGYTQQRYLSEQRKVSLRRQLASTVTSGVAPSTTLMDALSRFQNEQRTIDYVKLDAAQAGTIDPPTPEKLAAYFADHKFQYRAPEYRKISYVVLSPEELAKWTTVSDDDARKAFEVSKARMSTPEQRQISQIVFPTADEAAAARARLNDTFTFDDLAKERGMKPADVDLGMVAKTGILDPTVADAAFSAAADSVTQPVKSQFGFALVKVGHVQAGSQPSYDAVAVQVKRDLAIDRARATVSDLHNKMEDERGGGSSVVDAAKKLGLTAVTIDAVDRSGQSPDGKTVAGIPAGADVVSQAFSSDVGADTDALQVNGGYVWYDVLGITPSHDRTLDDVKDQVTAGWTAEQLSGRLRSKATDMVEKLGATGKLADEATAAGLKVETSAPFKRTDTVPGLPAGVVEAAFRAVNDGAGQAQGNSSSEWVVFRVTNVTDPKLDLASDDAKKLKDSLQRSLTDEQVAQYVTRIESDIGTKINQDAFAIATGAASPTDTN